MESETAMTNDVYEQIIAQLTGGELSELERKVFDDLKISPEGLTRLDLIGDIYGYQARYNAIVVGLSNSHEDRKIRKAIESLRRRLVPIVSTSSQAGYRLDASPEAIEKMLSELRSRRARIDEQIKSVEQFYIIPESMPEAPATVLQPSLL